VKVVRAIAAHGEPPDAVLEVWAVAAFANALIKHRAAEHLGKGGPH
jgi:hypothetical protein